MAEVQESNRLSVFLVEDNPCDVALFRQMLRKCGGEYSLIIVGDGIEAARRLNDVNLTKPDVVFLDLNLPGKSGTDVLREMKADPWLSAIPVAVLTASDDADDYRVCKALGVDAYLNKAEALQDFFALIAKIRAFLWSVSVTADRSLICSAA